jgi:hypothetical protein
MVSPFFYSLNSDGLELDSLMLHLLRLLNMKAWLF